MDWLKEYKNYLKEEKKFLKRKRKEEKEFTFGKFIVFLLLVLNLAIWGNYFKFKRKKVSLNKKNTIEICFLSIRGEAVLIKTKNKKILINTGLSRDIINMLKEKNIDYLDKVFITYPSKRNIGGANYLLYEDFPVGEYLFKQIEYSAPHYEDFLSLLEKKKIKYVDLKAGDFFFSM